MGRKGKAKEILELVQMGYTRKQIADKVGYDYNYICAFLRKRGMGIKVYGGRRVVETAASSDIRVDQILRLRKASDSENTTLKFFELVESILKDNLKAKS